MDEILWDELSLYLKIKEYTCITKKIFEKKVLVQNTILLKNRESNYQILIVNKLDEKQVCS